VRTRADLVFVRARIAIYVDGCFWHGCPKHGSMPKSNTDFWRAKIARNQQRDQEIGRLLEEQGWTVIRLWEHESAQAGADRVEACLAANSNP
jgi:DNA mismatch endonuclease (patch repair protein)